MKISAQTKIMDVVSQHGFVLDFLITLSPRYKLLKNPIARNTVGKLATLAQAASIGGLSTNELITKIATEIEKKTGGVVETLLSSGSSIDTQPFSDPAAKHEMLKAIIRHLHDGGDVETAKRQFAELVKDIDASGIAEMEQKLISEGMPHEEVKRLCDVHVQVFKETIEVKDPPTVQDGHPISSFMAENRALEGILDRLSEAAQHPALRDNIGTLLHSLQKVNIHYLRKENQLFPFLEKYGVSGPSQVMWSLDDDIRAMIKSAIADHEKGDTAKLLKDLPVMVQALKDMVYKEERILFPMAIETLSDSEWKEIAKGEQEIGYAWIKVETEAMSFTLPIVEKMFSLNMGELDTEQLNLMLTTLPIDISFVDENDVVRYYSASAERIFPRSPGVIGRKVQNCHPPKSMPLVQQILDDFRSGKRKHADFWLTLNGKFILIRYIAMRNGSGQYCGCLEVSQDVTTIRALSGEKRLLEGVSLQ